MFVLGFDVFNAAGLHPVDGVGAFHGDAPGRLLQLLRQFVQAEVKGFGAQGLEQIVAGFYGVGFQRIFRRI